MNADTEKFIALMQLRLVSISICTVIATLCLRHSADSVHYKFLESLAETEILFTLIELSFTREKRIWRIRGPEKRVNYRNSAKFPQVKTDKMINKIRSAFHRA